MDDFDRSLLRVTFALSLVAIVVVAMWLVQAHQTTDASCDLFEGQVTGRSSVSWLPPGHTCSYSDGVYVDSPSYLRMVVLVGAVGGLPFTWWMRRSLQPVARRPSDW